MFNDITIVECSEFFVVLTEPPIRRVFYAFLGHFLYLSKDHRLIYFTGNMRMDEVELFVTRIRLQSIETFHFLGSFFFHDAV